MNEIKNWKKKNSTYGFHLNDYKKKTIDCFLIFFFFLRGKLPIRIIHLKYRESRKSTALSRH